MSDELEVPSLFFRKTCPLQWSLKCPVCPFLLTERNLGCVVPGPVTDLIS